MTFEDRGTGCFKALATADAIGKQTEMLSRAEVRRWYAGGITGFHGRPGEVIPRYAGKRYEWCIGETTDDTEQTLAVTRALLREGCANHAEIGRELLQCRKSLHPGVALWNFVQIGDSSRIASDDNGCVAAMRAAPIGAAYECAIPTHGGQMAVCAAAAVAGAEVLTVALKASQGAESLRPSGGGPTLTESIAHIYSDLEGRPHLDVDEIADRYFPDRPQNIAPLAIGLALITQSARETALLAANVGGDSDSVASIGSAIAGALYPDTVNKNWFTVVNVINGCELFDLATSLATLGTANRSRLVT